MSGLLRFDADVLLLDIEGTISPISFVRDVLFAYARERLADFVAAHRETPAVAAILKDAAALGDGDPVAALIGWQERDVKAPPLKKLQGLIWESGYRDGAFKSALFPDALAALRQWNAAGLPLCVYSSGSLQAQALFFQFNEAGDLRPLFRAHFDTDTGAKTEAASYAKIAERIGVAPPRMVFLSDSPSELEAARAAGVQVAQVVKEDARADGRFAVIASFADVDFSLSPFTGRGLG